MGKLRLIFLVTPSSPIGSPAVFDDGVFRGFAMKFLFPAPSIKKVDTWNYLKNGKMRFFLVMFKKDIIIFIVNLALLNCRVGFVCQKVVRFSFNVI